MSLHKSRRLFLTRRSSYRVLSPGSERDVFFVLFIVCFNTCMLSIFARVGDVGALRACNTIYVQIILNFPVWQSVIRNFTCV